MADDGRRTGRLRHRPTYRHVARLPSVSRAVTRSLMISSIRHMRHYWREGATVIAHFGRSQLTRTWHSPPQWAAGPRVPNATLLAMRAGAQIFERLMSVK